MLKSHTNVQEPCLGGFLAIQLAENSEAEAKTISLDLVALTLSGLGLITIELVGTLEGSDNVRAML